MHGPNEAETAQPAGTGLDLAIIRGLVEAHAGSVVLEATHQLDGEFVRLEDRAVAPAVARFVQDRMATEVILGHRRRRRWRPWDTTGEWSSSACSRVWTST